jgi:hypothetical protein
MLQLYLYKIITPSPESSKQIVNNMVSVRFRWIFLTVLLACLLPAISFAQDTTAIAPDSSIVRKIEAGDFADVETPRRQLVKFNEYKGPYFSVRVGGGLLYDFGAFIQDANSKEQVGDLDEDIKFRDGRVVF